MNSFSSLSNMNLTKKPNVVAGPFKITDIPTCILWLDAKDPYNNSSVPFLEDRIQTWYDKSGGNRNATATFSPTSGTTAVKWTTVNGIPGFYFDKGATSSVNFNGNISITGNTVTVFAVSTYIDNEFGRIVSLTSGNGVNDYNNSSFMRVIKRGVTRSTDTVCYSDSIMPFNSTFVNYCQFNGTNCTVNALVGSSTTSTDVSTASSGNFGISYFAIGSNSNTAELNGKLNGYVHEVVVYNTVLTDSDRRKIEGYLSWKWGLQANQPSSHPYYSNAPTIASPYKFYSYDLNTFTASTTPFAQYNNIINYYGLAIAANRAVITGGAGNTTRLYLSIFNTSTQTWSALQYTNDTNTGYLFVELTKNGARGVTNIDSILYFFSWTGSNYSVCTQILDTTITGYFLYSIALSPNGDILVASADNYIYMSLWNGTNYQIMTQTSITSRNYYFINISNDGNRLVFNSNNGAYLSLWNGTTFGTATQFDTSTGERKGFAFSPDDNVLFNSIINGTVSNNYTFIWNGTTYVNRTSIPTASLPNNNSVYWNLSVVDNGANGLSLYAINVNGRTSLATFYKTNLLINSSIINQKTPSPITYFGNMGTIYCATQLYWTYLEIPINVDIYRNGTKIVPNYADSSLGYFFDMNLTAETTYTYALYAVGGSTAIASVTFKTPVKRTPLTNTYSITPFTQTTSQFMNMAVNHDGNKFMFCNGSNNLYYSVNRGVTISNISVTNPGLAGMCMNWTGTFMYMLINDTTAWYSTNSGTTWTSTTFSALPGGPATYFNCLRCNHIGNRILFYVGSTSTYIYLSTDFGKSFTQKISITQPSSSDAYTLYALPDFSKFIGMCGGNAKYVIGTSTDYGNTFTINSYDTNTNIGNGITTNEFGVAYDPTTSVFYGTTSFANTYYKSPDATGGGTWTPVTTSVKLDATTYTNNVNILYGLYSGVPSLDMSLLAGNIYNGTNWIAYYTLDKGVTWTAIYTATPVLNSNGTGIYFSSGDGSLVLFCARGTSTYGNKFCKWSL